MWTVKNGNVAFLASTSKSKHGSPACGNGVMLNIWKHTRLKHSVKVIIISEELSGARNKVVIRPAWSCMVSSAQIVWKWLRPHPTSDLRFIWSFHIWSFHPLAPAHSHTSSGSFGSLLLIKCLAQRQPRVIGSPPPPHTHIFQILLFCNSSSCDQMGYFFPSQSNTKSGTRAQQATLTFCKVKKWIVH